MPCEHLHHSSWCGESRYVFSSCPRPALDATSSMNNLTYLPTRGRAAQRREELGTGSRSAPQDEARRGESRAPKCQAARVSISARTTGRQPRADTRTTSQVGAGVETRRERARRGALEQEDAAVDEVLLSRHQLVEHLHLPLRFGAAVALHQRPWRVLPAVCRAGACGLACKNRGNKSQTETLGTKEISKLK